MSGFPINLRNPRVALIGQTDRATLYHDGNTQRDWRDPLEALRWLSNSVEPGQRWYGFLSYSLARQFESSVDLKSDPTTPLFMFGHTSGEASKAVQTSDTSAATSNFSKPDYLAAVERSIEYIRAGDAFQINLAQTFSTQTRRTPAEVQQRLHRRFPALYEALIELDDFAVVSNSPELFFRVEVQPNGSRRIINCPIKGTRPNAPGMFDELATSEKDKAELAMIVDLQRNDLGRICQPGTVRVTESRTIETHPTVLHGVATIEGTLRDDVGFVDILAALFPCGSVTGCPKIRAMQIIDELEPDPRGVYCGAIGWLDADGSMEFSVAIRTMTFDGSEVRIPVGGGIVADSVPEAEFDETITKARAMFESLQIDYPARRTQG